METKAAIEKDFKAALKNKDQLTVSVLRMLKASFQNKEIEKKGQALDEVEVIKIVSKQAQQHKDSIEQFAKGKRDDLVQKETQELKILECYLPQQLCEEEIVDIVKKVISETKAHGKADFGKVMNSVMSEAKGRAGGKLINQIVNQQLGA